MARDPKDGWDRLRQREEEEEAEREQELQQKLLKSRLQPQLSGRPDAARDLANEAQSLGSSGSTEKVLELFERVEPLLEQVHMLYGQYFSGIEKLPPLERRKQLDQVMHSLTLMAKPTQMIQFRFQGVQSRYRSYIEQWDRKLRDLEVGRRQKKIGR